MNNTNNNPPKEPIDTELTNEQTEKLISIIKSHFNIEDILYRIRPELKESYLNRKVKYPSLEKDDSVLIKIPVNKMNEEERYLQAYLCVANIIADIPSLMSYLNLMFEKLGNPSDKETIDNILEIGIANFYASKIKLYYEKSDDEDEDVNVIQKDDTPATEEEIEKAIEEIQEYPLFMTSMPKNPEENVHLQALQSLTYEGDASEVALDFLTKSKTSLELFYKNKKFKDLKEAMYLICNAIDHVQDDPKCDNVKYILYTHRAEIQLFVKNWGYAIDDLNSALKYKDNAQPEKGSVIDIDKTYLNLINAYIKIEHFKKALNIINERKTISQNDKYVQYEKQIKAMKQKLLDDLSKMEMFKGIENSKRITLYEELTAKGIKLKEQIHNIPPGYESEIYKDQNGLFHFPILIIYEEFNATDYIQDFCEDRLTEEIVDIIFENGRLPWDQENKYNENNCLCYFQCSTLDKITKHENVFYYPMRKDEKLIDVLKCKKVHMNGLPVVTIVSPNSSKFYEHFLKNKVIIKRKK